MDALSAAWQAAQVVLMLVGIALLCGLPFLLLACGVGMWERRMVWPYQPCEAPEAPPMTDYSRMMSRMAREQGFRHLGTARHGGGKLYPVRYDLWLSPDREVFAIVGAGAMAGIPVQTTWLYSKLVDGRVLITLDHHSGVTHDPTGHWSYALVLNADFPELMARHRARLSAEMTPVAPYSESDPLADHLAVRAAQADQVEAMGFATPLDEERMVWRLTPRGAISQAFQTYFTQWGQVLRNFSRQRLERPGQSGYVGSDRGAARTALRYAELACWIALIGGGVLLMSRPAANPAQMRFRMGLGALGLVGLVAARSLRWWLGRRERRASRAPAPGSTFWKILPYAVGIAVGLGVANWQAQQRRAQREAAFRRLMEAMPKFVEADVSLAELEGATRALPRFDYIGSDAEKHHFRDGSQPKVIRIFRVARKDWEPPNVLDLDDEDEFPITFRDGKLTCLGPAPGPATAEPTPPLATERRTE